MATVREELTESWELLTTAVTGFFQLPLGGRPVLIHIGTEAPATTSTAYHQLTTQGMTYLGGENVYARAQSTSASVIYTAGISA